MAKLHKNGPNVVAVTWLHAAAAVDNQAVDAVGVPDIAGVLAADVNVIFAVAPSLLLIASLLRCKTVLLNLNTWIDDAD